MSARKKAWQQFSDEIQATYVKGGILKSDRIEAVFQKWQMVYDIIVIPAGKVMFTYTRLRVPFTAKSDFQFCISKKSLFDKIAEKFGKSNIETGDSQIDDNFVIKSNSDEKINRLFSNEKLKNLLLEKSDSHFELSHGHKSIGRQFPKGCDGLSLVVLYESDRDMLTRSYNIFCEILTSLSEAGEIEDAPADVKL